MARVFKRGKSWSYRIDYYQNKERKYLTKGGFRTKKDAEKAAIIKENDLIKGKQFDQGKILLASYMTNWKLLYKTDVVSQKSISRIESIIRYVETNYNLPLDSITHENYQEFLNILSETRSRETVKKYHTYVKAAIQHALKTQVILIDPTSTAILKGKTSKTKKKENKYMNLEEFNRLESVIFEGLQPSFTSRYIILFAMYTGARFGECLGMTWDCVNFKKSTIRIEKGFDYHFTNDFTEGKTASAKRTISVPKKLMDLILTIPHQENSNQLFPVVTNNSVNKTLALALKRAKIDKPLTFHSLRHTHASILLSQGVQLLSVSKRLGHADPNITLKTYAHLLKELEDADNYKINEIFN